MFIVYALYVDFVVSYINGDDIYQEPTTSITLHDRHLPSMLLIFLELQQKTFHEWSSVMDSRISHCPRHTGRLLLYKYLLWYYYYYYYYYFSLFLDQDHDIATHPVVLVVVLFVGVAVFKKPQAPLY